MTERVAFEIQHLSVAKARDVLKKSSGDAAIPSYTAELSNRWTAVFKGKFLDPGENLKFLQEIHRVVSEQKELTSQRAIYYAIRGAHPDWTYKGKPLGQEFYDHLVNWVMEKLQLQTGLTIQSMGIWPGLRGYVAGDGTIRTPHRGVIPLSAKPTLIFDLADEGVVFSTPARKVIHFEKEAGFEGLTSGDFPKYVEAIFSTSQGQLTEASHKFLRKAEDTGMVLYSIHDGDPSGIQMQLMYGMASQNNCYMPSEFYPRLVKPLGFYPSIGEALGLPPEKVSDTEDKIFDNLLNLVEGKNRSYPELRRFGFLEEVDVIISKRQKWEFQALNAIHETAPKIYLLEGLRVHEDEIKHVPEAESIKVESIAAARASANQKVDAAIEALARSLLEGAMSEVVAALRGALAGEISAYNTAVRKAVEDLLAVDADVYREFVKRQLVAKPDKYASAVVKALGASLLQAEFRPKAELSFSYEVDGISSTVVVAAKPPQVRSTTTKTDLVDAIEAEIVSDKRVRTRIVNLIRTALENRFGKPSEEW